MVHIVDAERIAVDEGTHPSPSRGIVWERSHMTETIDGYAKSKGVAVRCLIASHPDGSKEYVLAVGSEPIYASTSAEFISARIDQMYTERLFADGDAKQSSTTEPNAVPGAPATEGMNP